MHETYEERRFMRRAGRVGEPRAPARRGARLAVGRRDAVRLYRAGRSGSRRTRAYALTAYPTRSRSRRRDALRGVPRRRSSSRARSGWSRRLRPDRPVAAAWRAGVYAFRFFAIVDADCGRVRRPLRARLAGFRVELRRADLGFFAEPRRARRPTRASACSRATRAWRPGRPRARTSAGPSSQRRRKLTRATVVVTTVLGVTEIRVARRGGLRRDRARCTPRRSAAPTRPSSRAGSTRASDACVSLAAFEADGAVVGHVLFSPVSVDGRSFARPPFGLGPVGVLPGLQRGGRGHRSVPRGHRRLPRARASPFLVVLGHPPYYPRFGFVPAVRFGLTFGGCAAARRVHGDRARARRARERRRQSPLRAGVRLSARRVAT